MSCAQPDCTRWSLTILPDSLRRPPHCHFILIILVISSLDVGVGSASILGGGSTSSSNIPGTSSSSSGSGGGASSTGVLGEQRSSPVLFDIIDRGSGPTGSGGGSSSSAGNYYLATEPVWVRNLDTQLLRLGSRLDQLMIRMDHLDSRVGRVQSQGHLRFDSIETSMQTTRQRLDLWSNQLNLIEEQLTRKWKNLESRFDSLVGTMDSKLDSKFNLIQRDNRRHNEFISSSFNSVIISQEKLAERVVSTLAEVNKTISDSSETVLNSTRNNTEAVTRGMMKLSRCPSPTASSTPFAEQVFSQPSVNASSHVSLVTSKVTNMFDELVKRSQNLEAIASETLALSNVTRRELQDGFRAFIPIVSQQQQVYQQSHRSGNGRSVSQQQPSSAEVMSTMIVETLASVESLSTALGRRVTDLTRVVKDRFDMVAMSLNGFLESCLRIQEKAPLIEEHIAVVLEKLLDAVDNSTRNATETWTFIQAHLKEQQLLSVGAPNAAASSGCATTSAASSSSSSLRSTTTEQPGLSHHPMHHGYHNINQVAPIVLVPFHQNHTTGPLDTHDNEDAPDDLDLLSSGSLEEHSGNLRAAHVTQHAPTHNQHVTRHHHHRIRGNENGNNNNFLQHQHSSTKYRQPLYPAPPLPPPNQPNPRSLPSSSSSQHQLPYSYPTGGGDGSEMGLGVVHHTTAVDEWSEEEKKNIWESLKSQSVVPDDE